IKKSDGQFLFSQIRTLVVKLGKGLDLEVCKNGILSRKRFQANDYATSGKWHGVEIGDVRK
ncbi:MAG: hypothetical protein K2F85_04525, partial [Helicobacter sp.]|nr:hypothetical protein [Helicobacter sp.]